MGDRLGLGVLLVVRFDMSILVQLYRVVEGCRSVIERYPSSIPVICVSYCAFVRSLVLPTTILTSLRKPQLSSACNKTNINKEKLLSNSKVDTVVQWSQDALQKLQVDLRNVPSSDRRNPGAEL